MSHTSLGASDVAMLSGEGGGGGEAPRFPHVPGSSLVGVVTKLGEDVTDLRLGDRVGLGRVRGACLRCRFCLGGREELCAAAVLSSGGGLSEKAVSDGRFAVKLPEEMGGAEGAALLGCGVLAFCALRHASAGEEVGVVGVGGVGHMAIQIARSKGCVVTAISRGGKASEALALGASACLDVSEEGDGELEGGLSGSLDFIVLTTDGIDGKAVSRLLSPGGSVCLLPGATACAASFDYDQMARKGQRVLTATPGGRRDVDAFLRFVKAHRIKPRLEIEPIARVNQAIEKMRAGEAGYCTVVERKVARASK